MPEHRLAVVVLAAGLGTRMKSELPKVLHKVAGRSMLGHVLAAAAALRPERAVIVAGPGMEEAVAAEAAKAGVPHTVVVQKDRLGTGHAVACAKPALEGYHGPNGDGDILILFGDTPLLRTETLESLVAARRGAGAPALMGLAFRPDDPARYGRVVTDEHGQVLRVVEYADASEQERLIGLCNAGILLGDGKTLFELVDGLSSDNAKGEYYLTDVFAMASGEGLKVRSVEADPAEVLGADSRAGLAKAEAYSQARMRAAAMDGGATLIDPDSVWFSWDTKIGRDVVIEPNVVFGPGVTIADEALIRAFCHLEGAEIRRGAIIGPFARLRPGSVIGETARVGNFVETKNAVLGTGAKANHLTYLGDAEVGKGANIGAGTITCNYDGIGKYRTTIGPGAFIGSNTALVAPADIGAGAIVGAGSTLGGKVAPDELVVVRGTERRSPGAATRFREQRQAEKRKREAQGK
jgi:bifunctional UDP-N-acetylglucosamine pyrophosphorylase/glucosamine-1-phosphate N-acetyltransferase